MTPFEVGLVALAATFALILGGMLVPVALMLCAGLGVWAIKGSPELAARLMAQAANEAIGSYFFGVIPLFVLTGLAVAEGGMGRDAYAVAHACTRRLRGGLGVATVLSNAVFAAITGISIASAAVFARVAVPEMRRHGYSARLATGVVAGSSVLGMLIPPSLLLILYAILTEQSVGDLFVAGVLPGLLLTALFCATALGLARVAPRRPGRAVGEADARREEGTLDDASLVARAAPMLALIALVLGGMYTGLFTPVEAGAVGAIGALGIGFLRRRLTLRSFGRILVETGLVTASVCLLIIAAQIYARMLAFSGVPAGLAALVVDAGLGYWGLMLGYVGVLVMMGTLLDSASILLIAVPIALPVIAPLQLDPVWFGIVTVLAVEVGLLTPPFGLSVHAIKATLDDETIALRDIFIGALPFALTMLVVIGLLLRFPAIATVLMAD